MNYNRNDSSLLHGGPVDIYDKNVTVAEQLWESMHNIIKFSSDMMRPFLAAMGVKTEDMSPFLPQIYFSQRFARHFLSDTNQTILDMKALWAGGFKIQQ